MTNKLTDLRFIFIVFLSFHGFSENFLCYSTFMNIKIEWWNEMYKWKKYIILMALLKTRMNTLQNRLESRIMGSQQTVQPNWGEKIQKLIITRYGSMSLFINSLKTSSLSLKMFRIRSILIIKLKKYKIVIYEDWITTNLI